MKNGWIMPGYSSLFLRFLIFLCISLEFLCCSFICWWDCVEWWSWSKLSIFQRYPELSSVCKLPFITSMVYPLYCCGLSHVCWKLLVGGYGLRKLPRWLCSLIIGGAQGVMSYIRIMKGWKVMAEISSMFV